MRDDQALKRMLHLLAHFAAGNACAGAVQWWSETAKRQFGKVRYYPKVLLRECSGSTMVCAARACDVRASQVLHWPLQGVGARSAPTAPVVLVILSVLVVLSLSGCGGDSGGKSRHDAEPQVISLDAGVSYEAAQGARLVTTTAEPTRVQIQHDAAGDLRHVTLLEGAADLYPPAD